MFRIRKNSVISKLMHQIDLIDGRLTYLENLFGKTEQLKHELNTVMLLASEKIVQQQVKNDIQKSAYEKVINLIKNGQLSKDLMDYKNKYTDALKKIDDSKLEIMQLKRKLDS